MHEAWAGCWVHAAHPSLTLTLTHPSLTLTHPSLASLQSGGLTASEIESTYHISRRIEGEERALDGALVVFTSTAQVCVCVSERERLDKSLSSSFPFLPSLPCPLPPSSTHFSHIHTHLTLSGGGGSMGPL
jgi:hypothetical protein